MKIATVVHSLDSLDHLVVTLVVEAEGDGAGLEAASEDGVFDGFRRRRVMPLTQIAAAVRLGRRRLLLHVEETPT